MAKKSEREVDLETFLTHEAEIAILRLLIIALIETHPNKPKVAEEFRTLLEAFVGSAPPNIHPELVVEIRARGAFSFQQIIPSNDAKMR